MSPRNVAESRRRSGPKSAEDEKLQTQRERWFIATFLSAGISLVAGMIVLSRGISSNFDANSPPFYTFVGMGIVTGIIWAIGKVQTRA